MRTRFAPTMCLCAVAAVLAAAAGAAVSDPTPLPAATASKKHKRPPLAKSPDLWATINVCDTVKNPNAVGVRASMPGLGGRRASLEMRFRVQYRTNDGGWKWAAGIADSGWRPVGRTRRHVFETGQTFPFVPPDTGYHTLRGVTFFRWLGKGGKTLKKLRKRTEAGHRSTAGADPAGYSAATCRISPP